MNAEYVLFMVYTITVVLVGVTLTIYLKLLFPLVQENELNWLLRFFYVQFLCRNFCFKCIPSCNSPVE